MATLFLDPGGDAGFNASTTSLNRGLWTTKSNNPGVAADFVHGGHLRSINFNPLAADTLGKNSILSDAGGRMSFYLYIVTMPGDNPTDIVQFNTSAGVNMFNVHVETVALGSNIFLVTTTDIGSAGPALSTGRWYRVSLAWTITSSTVNRFEAWLDGVSIISGTNVTLPATGVDRILVGNTPADSTLDFRISDIYIDDSSSLTDPGNIWVTAKRPNANGTTNGFTTQVGAGGSGYGTGHSPQVNERAASVTNGWSMVGAGSAVTEEYTIESRATGDIDLTGATIVDTMGWVIAKSLAGETAQIIVGGAASNISLTSTATTFTKAAGSASYPAGGTDIGIITDTSLTTVSLFECGIMVAYMPAVPPPSKSFIRKQTSMRTFY